MIPLEELRVAEMDRRGIAGYKLTPEEKAEVVRRNLENGVAHLVVERNSHHDAQRTDFRRGRERKDAPGRIRVVAKAAVTMLAALILWGGA